MAFGGVNGINIFEPGEIELNNTIPRVEITSVRVKNERINHANFDSPKKLSYEENTIFFSFASLDFNDPSKNVYKYKLDGVDKEWLKSGTNREVTYANLPPGSYTFRVMGTNNSGLWSEEEAIFAFVINQFGLSDLSSHNRRAGILFCQISEDAYENSEPVKVGKTGEGAS